MRNWKNQKSKEKKIEVNKGMNDEGDVAEMKEMLLSY